jgi:glycosyltransferase involved in cell wall biosynthesis
MIRGFAAGFGFIGAVLEKYSIEYNFNYLIDSSNIRGVIRNYIKLKELNDMGLLDKYNIVTLSTWENIIYYKKKPQQKLIAYPNGFIVGLNYDQTIKEVPLPKRLIHRIVKVLFDKKMQRKYKEADMLIVSTPNMLVHAKKLRNDAVWLPNPIDTDMFSIEGDKIVLEGNPSIFLPTRLHAFKNPLFGINLFKKIKTKYPNAKLHMIKYGNGEDPLFNAFKKIIDLKDVIYHDKMSSMELATYYRSADLVLGQFNETLGNLSMIELEAIACGASIVTLDQYEIREEFSNLSKLEPLAFRLLNNSVEDQNFKKEFIKRNQEYVYNIHSEKAVAEKMLSLL